MSPKNFWTIVVQLRYPKRNDNFYWKAEEEARAAKKGMWAQGDKYVSPREWRRGNSGN
jgi:endonuclease YncB( thermonuclease family)